MYINHQLYQLENSKLTYFNISDILAQDDLKFFHEKRFYKEIEHKARFSGFFFNIKNITRVEIENFVLFFGGDVMFLEDEIFLNKLAYFLSLFINQSLISHFMASITISELYTIFSNQKLTKMTLNNIMALFNKRINLEIYRFFLTFHKKYKKMPFKEFKNFVLSYVDTFDGRDFPHHYYSFLDENLVPIRRLHDEFDELIETLFYGPVTFVDIVEVHVDLLASSLHEAARATASLGFTKNQVYLDFKFLNSPYVTHSNIEPFFGETYELFISNMVDYFLIVHEAFTFFRYYLYMFYKLLLRKTNTKVIYKFYKLFRLQFMYLLEYYRLIDLKYFNTIQKLLILFFNEIRLVIYSYIFTKKNNLFFKFFLSFQYFNLRFFNLCRLLFINRVFDIDYETCFINYNNYLFYKFKRFTPYQTSDMFLILFDSDFLLKRKDLIDTYKNVYFNSNFSFEFKRLIFLDTYKDYMSYFPNFFFHKFSYYLSILTIRTIENYYIAELPAVNSKFSLKMWLHNFYMKYHNIFFLYDNLKLYNTLLLFFSESFTYNYMPIALRVKSEIEDFFFLLSEDFLNDASNMYFDDFTDEIYIEDFNPSFDIDEMEERYEDVYYPIPSVAKFDEIETSRWWFLFFAEDAISINYYTYDTALFKYKETRYPYELPHHFNESWDFDFENARLASRMERHILMYIGPRRWREIYNTFSPNMWYEWVSFGLLSDLTSFAPNYYSRMPEFRSFISDYEEVDIVKNNDYYGQYTHVIDPETAPKTGIYDRFFYDATVYDRPYFNDDPMNTEESVIETQTFERIYVHGDTHNLDETIDDENIPDENLYSDYSSFDDLANRFGSNEFINEIGRDPYFPDDYGLTYETYIRDLAVLNDTWIWWEYMSRMKHTEKHAQAIKNAIRPTNVEELLFLNTFLISGLHYVFKSVLRRAAPFEKEDRKHVISQLVSKLYHSKFDPIAYEFDSTYRVGEDKDIEAKLRELYTYISPASKDPRKYKLDYRFSNFEYYYNNWLNMYNGLIFLNDYQELVRAAYIYNQGAYHIPEKLRATQDFGLPLEELDPVIYNYLRRLQTVFQSILDDTFYSLIMSYYSYKYKTRLMVFWEHFFLTCVEIAYTMVDIHFVLDETADYEDEDFYFYGEEFIDKGDESRKMFASGLDYMYKPFGFIMNRKNDPLPQLIDEFTETHMDPFPLLHNGLDITTSFAETVMFDLYESYMANRIHTELVDYELDHTKIAKFFELDEIEQFYPPNHNRQDQIIKNFVLRTPTGFEFADERVAHKSIQHVNYYIGESYEDYLKRYYSIKDLNIFLYSLLNKYVTNLSLLNFAELSKEIELTTEDKIADLEDSNLYVIAVDLNQYKLNLLYYYLICICYYKLKKKLSFNEFFIVLVFFFFISYIKRLKLPVKAQSLLLLFFFSYFFYLLGVYLKKNMNIKTFKLDDFVKLSVSDLYNVIKFIIVKFITFVKFYVKATKFFLYKHLFYKKYVTLIRYFFKNKMYKLFFIHFIFKNVTLLDMPSVDLVTYAFGAGTSFRSSLSTLNVYMPDEGNVYKLTYNPDLFKYLFGNNTIEKTINASVFKDSVDKTLLKESNNFSLSYFNNFFVDEKLIPFALDNLFIDFFDDIREAPYHDFGLDDAGGDGEENETPMRADEWQDEISTGDETDNYFEIDEDGATPIENQEDVLFQEEELDFELDLDPSIHDLFDEFPELESNFLEFDNTWNYNKVDNKLLKYHHNTSFFLNRFLYMNYSYIRLIFMKLLYLYKKRVPITSPIHVHDNSLYFFRYAKRRKGMRYDQTRYNYFDERKIRKDSLLEASEFVTEKALRIPYKKFSGKNHNDFFSLLPKYVYTHELSDIFDYFIDYNNLYTDEFDEQYDIFTTTQGFGISNVNNRLSDEITSFSITKLYIFYRYVLLYYYIYQYIDKAYSPMLLYSFFFFDLLVYFRKTVRFLYNYKNGRYRSRLDIKYIFDKIYLFLYRQLVKFRATVNIKLSNILIGSTYRFIPFYEYNYEAILRKISILKGQYTTSLSLFSYYLLLKGFEYLVSFGFSKKRLYQSFCLLKDNLKQHEALIFFNSYKLAQIYAKYGLVDSFYFFDNLLLTTQINETHTFHNKNFRVLYRVVFFIEFLYFVVFVVFMICCLIEIRPNLLRKFTMKPDHYLTQYDEGLFPSVISFHRNNIDYRLGAMITDQWYDLWGIF